MSTGPDRPDSTEKAVIAIEVDKLEILTCSTCKKDSLFAQIKDINTGKEYMFCSRCGGYFEIKN